MGNSACVVAVSIGLIFAAGCGSPRRGAPVTGPWIAAAPQLDLGRRVYEEHCHMCHPGGEGGLGPSLNDKLLPAVAIRTQVRHGLGVMPHFPEKEIPPKELEALVAYMKALRGQRLEPERLGTRR